MKLDGVPSLRNYEPDQLTDATCEKKMNSEKNPGLVPVKKFEAGEVSALARRIWPVVYAGMISKEQIEFMLEWMYAPSQIQNDMENGIIYCWIEWDSRRVGFTAFDPLRQNGDCEIHKLYIHPEHHRRGIGMKTLRQVEKLATANDVTLLHLRVNRDNQSAIALYRKAGFTIAKEDVKNIGGGFVMDDFIFQKQISSASG